MQDRKRKDDAFQVQEVFLPVSFLCSSINVPACVCVCVCALQSFLYRYQHQVIYADFRSGSTHLSRQKTIYEMQCPIFSELRFQRFCISIPDFLLSFSFKAQHRVRKQETLIGLKHLGSRNKQLKCSPLGILI